MDKSSESEILWISEAAGAIGVVYRVVVLRVKCEFRKCSVLRVEWNR